MKKVTVGIPVKDGARYLDEVLTAVRAQRLDPGVEVELLVVDSGSRDDSPEIAARHGARVHRIEPHEFSHGGTRNLIVELADGEVVAFLTQDATPAHEGWLAALLEGFAAGDDVAAVFGPHLPRDDASHMIKCEMERHFEVFGDGGGVDVQRLDRSPEGIAAYRAFPGRLSFLSDVNCAVARWAWQRVPYREVPYAEDQLLGRELIEAGYAKAYAPRAAVVHSHDYPPLVFFRRWFDEFRSLREVLGHRERWGPKRTLWDVRGMVGMDKRWLRARGVSGPRLARALAVSARHHGLRQVAAILGSRAGRLPRRLRKLLSLDGRATYEPFDLPGSPLLRPEGRPGQRKVRVSADWPWEFVRRSYPERPIALDPERRWDGGPMALAWVVPPWKVGSGGHTTIFRLVRELEARGHRSTIYVFDPLRLDRRGAGKLEREVKQHFIPVAAEVRKGLDGFEPADLAIATNWWTAYPVRDLPGCGEKAYLVQDDEPSFYAASAESIWAEATYRMGYRCIAYTPWMAELLSERYGLEARWFECGTDLDTYAFAGPEGREPNLVAVYARQETPRRAVELALAGLATLWERRPGLRVVLFGSNKQQTVPFPCEDLGVAPPAQLAELYRRASAGVVFSLTTHSLVAQEMMASGLATVELAGRNVSSALGESGEVALLAEPRPDAIADAVERLLDEPAEAAAIATRARGFVEERSWERAGEQVESALQAFLASPRG